MNENSAPLKSRVSDQLEIWGFLQTFTEGPNCVIGGVSKFQLTGKPLKRPLKLKTRDFNDEGWFLLVGLGR